MIQKAPDKSPLLPIFYHSLQYSENVQYSHGPNLSRGMVQILLSLLKINFFSLFVFFPFVTEKEV